MVVRHDDLELSLRGLRQSIRDLLQTPQPDPAFGEGPAMSRVDADDQHLFVFEERFEDVVKVSAIGAVGIEYPLPDSPERHVMVAGYRDAGSRQTVDEGPCLSKLLGFGSLREVARNNDQIRSSGAHHPGNCIGQPGEMRRAKVNVRYVENSTQSERNPWPPNGVKLRRRSRGYRTLRPRNSLTPSVTVSPTYSVAAEASLRPRERPSK